MKITILIENLVYKQGLKGEHGLSMFISNGKECILFDTGQTNLFIHNSKILDINIHEIKYAVLSHGHYDHTGGLKHLIDIRPKLNIIMKPESIQDKYSNSTGSMRSIGIDKSTLHTENIIYPSSEIIRILDEVYIISEIKNYTNFENDEKNLFQRDENNNYILDSFDDELFIVIENSENYISIITGCAHRGIINILKTAQSHFPNKKIKSIIGGFHLKGKSKNRIKKTIEELVNIGIEEIYVNHCSGIDFYTELIKRNLDIKVNYAHTGYTITYDHKNIGA